MKLESTPDEHHNDVNPFANTYFTNHSILRGGLTTTKTPSSSNPLALRCSLTVEEHPPPPAGPSRIVLTSLNEMNNLTDF